jgi:hypothetical protein
MARIMRRLNQWRNLAHCERRLLVRLALLLPLIGLALHLLGYRTTYDQLARLSKPSKGRCSTASVGPPAETARHLARLVRIAANHGPYRATCLRQALALWWMLRRRGIAAELHIGVRKEEDRLQAHAWVEHQGLALNETQSVNSRYAAFATAVPERAASQR